eukprot:11191777-Lingulodinium_polyedra.AAC.1
MLSGALALRGAAGRRTMGGQQSHAERKHRLLTPRSAQRELQNTFSGMRLPWTCPARRRFPACHKSPA